MIYMANGIHYAVVEKHVIIVGHQLTTYKMMFLYKNETN